MKKNVVFSDSPAALAEEQRKLMAAGSRAQLRDLTAYLPDWTVDAQFRNALGIIKLSDTPSEAVLARAAEIREKYGALGVVFFDDAQTLLAKAHESVPAQTDTVEGVDTPTSGIGTIEDFKAVTNRRKK